MLLNPRLPRLAAPALLTILLAAPAIAQNNILDPHTLAPFVPTPDYIVEQMLSAAKVTKNDVLYDLGSGDGRILFTAAESFGARAVGIEINSSLVEMSRQRIAELELGDRVKVVQNDLLAADLSEATVVTVYLLSSTNEQLKPKLEAELKPGSRVVSHDFRFMGWKEAHMVEVPGDRRAHRIYVYEMGAHLDE